MLNWQTDNETKQFQNHSSTLQILNTFRPSWRSCAYGSCLCGISFIGNLIWVRLCDRSWLTLIRVQWAEFTARLLWREPEGDLRWCTIDCATVSQLHTTNRHLPLLSGEKCSWIERYTENMSWIAWLVKINIFSSSCRSSAVQKNCGSLELCRRWGNVNARHWWTPTILKLLLRNELKWLMAELRTSVVSHPDQKQLRADGQIWL